MFSISRRVVWGVSRANKAADRSTTRLLSITREELQKYGGLNESDRVAMIIQHSSSAAVVDPDVFEQFDPSLARGVVELRQDISTLLNSKKQQDQKRKLSSSAVSALTEADSATSKWLGQFYAHDQVELRPINFDVSSVATIQAVADREKVLSAVTTDNLKSRLSNGRYLYGLFHKDIPEDPLVFVHIVLTNEFSGSIDAVEHNVEVTDPQYAMFYSISSSYTALKNIGLPQLLLKRAKEMLQNTIPSIHTYSTLSPIPGFLSWLMSTEANKVTLPSFVQETILRSLGKTSDTKAADTDALQVLRDNVGRNPSRMLDPVFAEQIKPSMQWLCAYYLSQTTRTMANGKVIPLDDVANFHLRNGASLYRLNYHADLSPAALGRSAGMMVNYLYTSKIHKPLQNVPGYSMPVGQSIVDILHCRLKTYGEHVVKRIDEMQC